MLIISRRNICFTSSRNACLKKRVADGAIVDALVDEFVEKAAKSLSDNGYEYSADNIRGMLNGRVSVTASVTDTARATKLRS
jgi:uncharacterized protein YaiI (UPF0178 family)